MTITNGHNQCAFTTMPPNMDATILMLLTKPGFISKYDASPFVRPKFVVDHTIEDALVCDTASRVAAVMVSQL
ncbi:hypothetical protein TNCV_5085611 [Trichonephila clavipes]|uniref:Uncharacterized protein n=1 Tax=Trichonephila clavipes TaxID=2585209 RepID=A0A8X6S6F1_TRICX|nr:hypothetical protein TNCV_5085611 [Trichonephila clavipes]